MVASLPKGGCHYAFIHFEIAQGTLPWQPILWTYLQNLPTPPSLIALSFRNGLEYRNANGCFNSGNDASASFENLVSFGTVTSEFMRRECVYGGGESSMWCQLVFTIFSHSPENLISTRDSLVLSCIRVN